MRSIRKNHSDQTVSSLMARSLHRLISFMCLSANEVNLNNLNMFTGLTSSGVIFCSINDDEGKKENKLF